jgi:DNA polymerase-3 subunit epsilon
MRQIILDTETTGLEPEQGHRIIELGCLELVNRRPSGRTFHRYLNPDRDIDEGALQVHGITREFLRTQPRFADVVDEFLEFVAGAELVIHNAAFDVGFLEAELKRLGARGTLVARCRVLDTLALARQLHPGQRNSLDALCKRYSVDNSSRDLHGALLDAKLLSEVFLAMTGGQGALTLGTETGTATASGSTQPRPRREPFVVPVIRATTEELEKHERALDAVAKAAKGACLFRAPA